MDSVLKSFINALFWGAIFASLFFTGNCGSCGCGTCDYVGEWIAKK